MDMRSNDNNRDMMLGGINSNSIERKFEIIINHSLGQGDTEAILTYKIPSQQIENRNNGCRIETTRSDRHLESMEMLSEELNIRLSQVADSLMNILKVQITKAINSAINNSVIPEIQNAIVTLSSGQRDPESGSSQNNQEDREGSNGLKTKIIKKDSRSACNLRDTEGRSPYKPRYQLPRNTKKLTTYTSAFPSTTAYYKTYMTVYKAKQAGNDPSWRDILGSKIAKGLKNVKVLVNWGTLF